MSKANVTGATVTVNGKLFAFPFEYAPQQGLKGPSVVPVRPDEQASLVVEVQGPVAKPAFAFSATTYTFDETLAADESLVCRDGCTWKVIVTATGKARRHS